MLTRMHSRIAAPHTKFLSFKHAQAHIPTLAYSHRKVVEKVSTHVHIDKYTHCIPYDTITYRTIPYSIHTPYAWMILDVSKHHGFVNTSMGCRIVHRHRAPISETSSVTWVTSASSRLKHAPADLKWDLQPQKDFSRSQRCSWFAQCLCHQSLAFKFHCCKKSASIWFCYILLYSIDPLMWSPPAAASISKAVLAEPRFPKMRTNCTAYFCNSHQKSSQELSSRMRVLFTGGDKLRLRPPEHAPFKLVNIYGALAKSKWPKQPLQKTQKQGLLVRNLTAQNTKALDTIGMFGNWIRAARPTWKSNPRLFEFTESKAF